ncbi:hypothetical protein CALVIDRAFT_218196 [Calocera viscosa TUFC12733]|uniref:Uncharacterized protein n=1 Tax=Calocera viscosa (strain TUFC12733) TaxID=1330018 RepID=A0A167RIT5_CALVF|nr:hypothetical protein CALVIDRAFT_218196 [Calocera viscosa TUFC12733]
MAASTPSLVNLPPGSERVTDADEEVFLLYTLLSSSSTGGELESGLGFVDNKKGEITVSFDLVPPVRERHRRRRSSGRMDTEGKHVEVILAQDLGGLRNRKGDTGSVLWRASMHLAQQLLQEHYYPPSPPAAALLHPTSLATSHILELGSGTGLLSVLLSPLVRKYTATDIPPLLPLLGKNADSNQVSEKVAVEELDWVTLEATLSYLCRPPVPSPDAPSEQRRPTALVMSELRDPEVMREFLALWLELDKDEGGWEVWRAGEGVVRGTRCVIWVGWRVGGV